MLLMLRAVCGCQLYTTPCIHRKILFNSAFLFICSDVIQPRGQRAEIFEHPPVPESFPNSSDPLTSGAPRVAESPNFDTWYQQPPQPRSGHRSPGPLSPQAAAAQAMSPKHKGLEVPNGDPARRRKLHHAGSIDTTLREFLMGQKFMQESSPEPSPRLPQGLGFSIRGAGLCRPGHKSVLSCFAAFTPPCRCHTGRSSLTHSAILRSP